MLAIQEAEIKGGSWFEASLGKQIVHKTLSQKNTTHKKGLVE
jgi:hypothetical protein